MEKKETEELTAKELYKQIEPIRKSLEHDWQDASQLTIPYIFPRSEVQSESTTMPTPYNSIGSSSVNVLASKLLIALLPPSGVFFRLLPDFDVVSEMTTDEKSMLDSELSKVEQDVVELINRQALRVPTYEAIKLLIVTGNAMMYKVPNGTFKVFSPYQYVVQRDYVGEVLYACIKEKMGWDTIPEKVKKQLEESDARYTDIDTKDDEYMEVTVYTAILREGKDKYKVWQEIEGIKIEGTEKKYSKDKLPYLILRWTTVNNESYGRGLVEQYLGDLRSLEGLTQTIVEGAGIAALQIFGLRPGSNLKVEDLNNAKNGQFVLGDLEREVSTLQVNKNADLQVPLQLIGQLEQRIAKAFLNLGGQIRDSERTTATEVRATVAELEATLGGIFSVLATEFQKPLVTLLLHELVPDVLKITTPSITTGIGAISRERDFQNLNTMLQSTAQLGPEILMKYMKIDAYLAKVATALGMEPDEIIKSPQQIQQEAQAMQQQQQQQFQQQAALEGVKAGAQGGQQ